jgi:hypothetical protein
MQVRYLQLQVTSDQSNYQQKRPGQILVVACQVPAEQSDTNKEGRTGHILAVAGCQVIHRSLKTFTSFTFPRSARAVEEALEDSDSSSL